MDELPKFPVGKFVTFDKQATPLHVGRVYVVEAVSPHASVDVDGVTEVTFWYDIREIGTYPRCLFRSIPEDQLISWTTLAPSL